MILNIIIYYLGYRNTSFCLISACFGLILMWNALEWVKWFITSVTSTGLTLRSQHPICSYKNDWKTNRKVCSLCNLHKISHFDICGSWSNQSEKQKILQIAQRAIWTLDSTEHSLQQMRCQMDLEHVLQYRQYWINKVLFPH